MSFMNALLRTDDVTADKTIFHFIIMEMKTLHPVVRRNRNFRRFDRALNSTAAHPPVFQRL